MNDRPRILPITEVPRPLWNADVLYCPAYLVQQYDACLSRHGLLEEARLGTSRENIHGGPGTEETRIHFAHRFGVSVGRVEFVAIDPRDVFRFASNALLSSFSEGRVALLDIPCGTGAATCSLASCLLELRRHFVLPRLPLTIAALGADVSESALGIAAEMIEGLREPLEQQGILMQWDAEIWDATRGDHTARLVDRWFALNPLEGEYFVVVSNFSGALSVGSILDEVTPCLEHILARLHNRKSTVLWIEPASVSARERLIPKIWDFFKRRIPWFSSSVSADSPIPFAEYNVCQPIRKVIHPSGVAVQRFHRT